METLIALLLAAILGAFGGTGKVERGIEAKLRQDLGRVGEVKVDIRRGFLPSRSVQLVDITLADFNASSMPGAGGLQIGGGGDLVGRVKKVAIHARNFRVNDLPVAKLDVTINEVRYDLWRAVRRRELEVIRVGNSYADATLKADALTRMIAPRVKQVRNIKLTFGRGELTVTGDAHAGVDIPVKLTCGLAAVGGGKVYVVDPRAHVSIVPVPTFVVNRLLKEINPLVDLNAGGQGPFELAVRQMRITPRALQVHADLHPRKRPPAPPAPPAPAPPAAPEVPQPETTAPALGPDVDDN